MRDLFAHYALLAGILFFVGRLHVFASLADAFVAGLLATATVGIALLAYDRVAGTTTTDAPALHPTAQDASSPHTDA